MKHTVEKTELLNGAKGLLIHVPNTSVVSVEISFRAGDYLAPEGKAETPHLMEHLLLGANELYPKARLFQSEIEKNGAYSNASTGPYNITYEAECADFEWQRVLDLMLAAITKPLFLRDEFKAEFGNVREELTARSNNHYRHLSLALRQAYGFVARTDQQRLKLMNNVKLKDVQDHYTRTHTTRNMRFVIAGNITPGRREAILKTLETIALPKGTGRLALPHERPTLLAEPLYIHNRSVKNAYFYIDSFMRRRLADEESDALSLLNTMLTETLYSKILGTARERGLVYGMSSGWSETRDVSNWWFGAQVSFKNMDALFDIIVFELQKVFAGDIETADLAAAQAYSLGRFQRSAQTVSGVASGYGRYFFDEVVEDYFQVPRRIKAITKESMTNVARHMLADGVWGFGVLGNGSPEVAAKHRDKLAVLWRTVQKD